MDITHRPGNGVVDLPEKIKSNLVALSGLIDTDGEFRPTNHETLIYSGVIEVSQTTGSTVGVWSGIARVLDIDPALLPCIRLEIRALMALVSDMAMTDRLGIIFPGAGARPDMVSYIGDVGLLTDHPLEAMLDGEYDEIRVDSPDWGAGETFTFFLFIRAYRLSRSAGYGVLV